MSGPQVSGLVAMTFLVALGLGMAIGVSTERLFGDIRCDLRAIGEGLDRMIKRREP